LLNELLCPRNPVESKSEAIQTRLSESNKEFRSFFSTLLASGFYELPVPQFTFDVLYGLGYRVSLRKFLPCPVGTFSNYSSKGAEGCIPCPPGMSSVFIFFKLMMLNQDIVRTL